MAQMGSSLNKFVAVLKSRQDWFVILVLVLLLAGVLWRVQQVAFEDPVDAVRRILAELGYGTTGEGQGRTTDKGFEEISARLLTVPREEEIVQLVIQKNPFQKPEDIKVVREEIRALMQTAELFRTQRKWAEAIEAYDRVLDRDPQMNRISYTQTPGELKDQCRREQTREQMDGLRFQAIERQGKGMALLEEGKDLEARDQLSAAEKAFEDLLDMDRAKEINDEAFYKEVHGRLDSVSETLIDLNRRTLEKEIEQSLELADDQLADLKETTTQIGLSDLSRLASVRDGLIDTRLTVDRVDPDGEIVSDEQLAEMDNRLLAIGEVIDEIVPGLLEQAQASEDEARAASDRTDQMAKIKSGFDLYEILKRLRPDQPQFSLRAEEMRTALAGLRQQEDLEQARSYLGEAQRHYETGLSALENGDAKLAIQERDTALALIDRIGALPEEHVGAIGGEAEKLRRDVEARLRTLKSISGARLLAIDSRGGKAKVYYKGKPDWFVKGFAYTGRKIRMVKEIDRDAGTVIISAPGFLDTTLRMQE